ncbi:MAG: DNA-directed DNA polymerase I [Candidatus Methanomethylicota archaeon]|uniref:DNA polymerase n=1 Tax=Thermoproteota archaeon TaxID=2056631 RepID=A0A497ET68_9CREN|nr:MAG: DNA-directed DNA polymerase I [Candidatus Verstraetearchaeota archaeon]
MKNFRNKRKIRQSKLSEFESEDEEFEEVEEVEVIEAIPFEVEQPINTGPCILLSVSYDGSKGKALCKLYDPENNKVYFWYDNTGHKPYCLSDLPPDRIKRLPVVTHPGYRHVEVIEKYDPLSDRVVRMSKIIAEDPLSIGGGPKSIRDLLPKAWEARIRYHNCYIYDRQLIPGLFYKIENGDLKFIPYEVPSEIKNEILKHFKDEPKEVKDILEEWLPLFLCPAPNIPRLAIDIEVYTPQPDRIPEPSEANYPVICVAFASSDGLKKVFLLKRSGLEFGSKSALPSDVELVFFDNERQLIIETFKLMTSYPIVLTFNGDKFDLRYLRYRASKLGIPRREIPIILGRQSSHIVTGVHIDLYRLFANKSVQVYAFSNKYKDVTLDAIAHALLGISKIPIDRLIAELTYFELAAYCFRDAEITLQLTTFDEDLVLKLIILLMRISKLSMEDVTRQGVSGWIKNMLYFEHRKRNYLIPEREDILAIKGRAVTRAIIKGKKYMGAIVIEPKPGAFFNVTVLDFASLYPSVLYRWNLSYETINCPHKECRENKIPNLPHWICKKRLGLTSTIIGILRNIRVYWFKPKSKDKSLDEATRSWYSVVQRGLKVILNASYGVMGNEVFPLYCPPVAESTTALGRYIISKAIEKAREMGLEVIYGDTDSIFLHNPTQEQIRELVEWAKNKFRIDLDVDKIYRYVTFSGLKKNYLGVFDDGSVDIKGLVGKKRNTPEFLKTAFNNVVKVLSEVKSPEDFERAKEKIRAIAQECYRKLREHKLSLDELAFRVKLSKPLNQYVKTTPQHVKAARLLERYGKKLGAGDIISYVKVKGEIGVKPVQLARIDEIDINKYLGHMETTFRQVLEAIGINFDEILGVTSLDLFLRKRW